MKKQISFTMLAIVVLVFMLFQSCSNNPQTCNTTEAPEQIYTINFCRGILPYTGYDGVYDSYIVDGNKSNTNNGICDELILGSYNFINRYRAVIKFEIGGFIPSTAEIKRAFISLSLKNSSNFNTIKIYAFQFGFVEGNLCDGYSETSVTWNNIAGLPGGYYSGLKQAGTFSISEYTNSGFFQVEIDKKIIKSWIDNSTANHGFLLIDEQENELSDSINHYVKFHSSEHTSAIYRPMLTIIYTLP